MVLIAELSAVFVLIGFVVYWYVFENRKKIRKFYDNIPGPPGVPILGNALDFQTTDVFLDVLLKYRKQYGGMFKIKIGPMRYNLVVSDYKVLEFLMSSNKLLHKSVDYRYLLPWLGTGLLTSHGEKWKVHRKLITPAFHFKILEQFIDVFESATEIMIDKLKKIKESRNIDIYRFITLCALDIICESAMGTKVNAQENEESDYVQSVKHLCRILMERSMSPIKMYDLLFQFTADYRIEKKSLNILHTYTTSVIRNRQKQLKSEIRRETDDHQVGIKNRRAFLDLLLEANSGGEQLTLDEIREEVDTFMFEGHDTTASAMSFAVYSLANNPDVQRKALEEQQRIFGDNKNPKVTYTNLQDMKYLELVIKETLRLYPSVPVYARNTDQELEYEGTIIPSGVTIVLFAHGIHRDPAYFPDPEKFEPERFSNFDGRSPYAYIPFSAGPRNCIGQKFAMLEMKSTISKILRNFELFPANPQQNLCLLAETVLKPKGGMQIGIKIRE